MAIQRDREIRVPLSEQMVAQFEKAIDKQCEVTGQRMSLTEFLRRGAIRYAMDIEAGNADPWV